MHIVEYAYFQGVNCEPRLKEYDDWDAIGPSAQQWIRENGCTLRGAWCERTTARAAIEGRLDVVKFLYSKKDSREKTSGNLGRIAEAAGHMNVADYCNSMAKGSSASPKGASWLEENGGHIWGGWGAGTFGRAAYDGRRDVVVFLYHAGCNIDGDITTSDYKTSCFLTSVNIPHGKIIPPMPKCGCLPRCGSLCKKRWHLFGFTWVSMINYR
jgi:hypothetical protein